MKKITTFLSGPLTPQIASIRLTLLKGVGCQTGVPAGYFGDDAAVERRSLKLFLGKEIRRKTGRAILASDGSPVNSPSNEPSPVSEAMTWVSRILAVAAVMVLPGLAGQWLDKRWGVGFLGLTGLAVGVCSGIAYLLAITKSPPDRRDGGRSAADQADKDKRGG